MTEQELNIILYEMSYNEYVDSLKAKYGNVPKDYFYVNRNGHLAKSQGNTRGNEGLYIHHIYECYYINLSDVYMYHELLKVMDEQDWKDAQKSENLVYCNLLEHLILHIKIALEYQREQYEVGINFITTDLNRLYDLGDQHLIEEIYSAKNQCWKQVVYQLIKDDYPIYVILVRTCITKLNISIRLMCSTIDGLHLFRYIYWKLYEDIINTADLTTLFNLLDEIEYDYVSIINAILKIDNSESTFITLSRADNYSIREYIASKEQCPISVLELLANDYRVRVRCAVLSNPNCPKSVIDRLNTDKAKSIQKIIQRMSHDTE